MYILYTTLPYTGRLFQASEQDATSHAILEYSRQR